MTAAGEPMGRLRQARRLIDEHCCEPLEVTAIAGSVGLSRAYFSREFRSAFGVSPHRYVVEQRLERAAALLRETDRPVAEICSAVGWRSIGSFTTTFTHEYGCPPTAYRRGSRRGRTPARAESKT